MITQILKEVIFFYNEVSVYLVFGFIVAGLLHIFFSEALITKLFGKDNTASVIKASIFGIPLPLCSCGVLPVAVSLKNNGASKGATVSFLITTPQVGADSFMITYSLLGWVFAVFRIIASVITGFTAGIAMNFLKKDNPSNLQSNLQSDCSPDCTSGSCAGGVKKDESMTSRAKNVFSYVEYSVLGSIAGHLIIGIILAGIIAVLIPDDFFAKYMTSDILSIFLMLLIGIPMYVCASASTPIAAALIMKGISPGAALVFLLTGPATNAIGISAVYKMLGKNGVLLYLAAIAVVSLVIGSLLNAIVYKFGFQSIISMHHGEMLPNWLKLSGSVLLTLMLSWYYIKTKILNRKTERNLSMKTILNVNGMNCMHCSGSVHKAVESVSGTSDIFVDLKDKNVSFDIEDENNIKKVKEAVISAGYKINA
jgi:uncharacterized protein